MTGSKPLRRWSVALLAVVTAATAACSTGTPSASNQPSASTTAPTTGTTSPAVTPTGTPTEAPPTTGIVKDSDGWSTYTNAELGFSFRFPTRIYAGLGAPCTKNQESGGWSYRPSSGVVPATVIQDRDSFYVTQKISYQLGDAQQMADGTTKYKACTKTVTTVKMIRAYVSGTSDYLLAVLPISVVQASTRADVKSFAVTTFDHCASVTVASMVHSPSGPWRKVLFSCPEDQMFFNYAYDARLYQAHSLFVMFWFGQAIQIYDARQRPADNKIAASFKILP
jgi:hypothetical protein